MRIPKRTLYAIVEEARACGIGPRELAASLGYTPRHLSRIATRLLSLPPMHFHRFSHGIWSDKLRDMVLSIGDIKSVAKPARLEHPTPVPARPEET